MTTPISGLPPVVLQGVANNSLPGGATVVPPGILALPSGTLLRGAISKIENGVAILSTLKGDISLKSDLPLLVGNEIVLRLDTTPQTLRARIISVDGTLTQDLRSNASAELPQDVLQIAGRETPLPAADISSSAPLAEELVDLPEPPVLKAILLSRADNLPEILSKLPLELTDSTARLASGSPLLVRLQPATIQLPNPVTTPPVIAEALAAAILPPEAPSAQPFPQPSPAPSAPQPAASPLPGPLAPEVATPPASPSTNILPQAAAPADMAAPAFALPRPSFQLAPVPANKKPAAGSAIPTALPPLPQAASAGTVQDAANLQAYQNYTQGNQAALAPRRDAPPVTPPLPPEPEGLAQGVLPSIVLGAEKSGEMVLQTPLGTIKLTLPSTAQSQLPPGTQMQFEIVSLKSGEFVAANPQSDLPESLLALSSQWKTLEDAGELLAQLNPAAGQELRASLPAIGPRFTAGVVFFLAALQGGDLRRLTGERTLDALEKSPRSDLARKLVAEFGVMRQAFADPTASWQTVPLPFLHEGELQQARLFFRRDDEPQEEAQQGGSKGTRFVMEVDLTRLGSLQFDGMVRRRPAGLHFDLIMRSHAPLPEEDMAAIRSIYQQAAETTGFSGQLAFQAQRNFTVNPMEQITASHQNTVA